MSKDNYRIVDMYRSNRNGKYMEGDLRGVRSTSLAWSGPYRCKVWVDDKGNQNVEVLEQTPETNVALTDGVETDVEEGEQSDGTNPDVTI